MVWGRFEVGTIWAGTCFHPREANPPQNITSIAASTRASLLCSSTTQQESWLAALAMFANTTNNNMMTELPTATLTGQTNKQK